MALPFQVITSRGQDQEAEKRIFLSFISFRNKKNLHKLLFGNFSVHLNCHNFVSCSYLKQSFTERNETTISGKNCFFKRGREPLKNIADWRFVNNLNTADWRSNSMEDVWEITIRRQSRRTAKNKDNSDCFPSVLCPLIGNLYVK